MPRRTQKPPARTMSGPVGLEPPATDPDAGEVCLRVLDRGPSLAEDELDRTFELPAGSSVGRLAGSGVGPFVARHLVESMGGRVWARNRSGGGLETGFALPIDERG